MNQQEWIEYFELVNGRKPTPAELAQAQAAGEFILERPNPNVFGSNGQATEQRPIKPAEPVKEEVAASKEPAANEEVKKELSQIIIEGHTDDVGSYIYNMELSQKRAFEVIKYIYDEMPNFKGKEELKSYITANGRSNIKVLRDNSGNIDRDKSRRVEFQFKRKEDETLMKSEKSFIKFSAFIL